MNTQHSSFLIAVALLWMCAVGLPRAARAQMLGVSVEVDTVFGGPSIIDPTGELEGYTSYLLYANFTNPTDVLSAVYSDTQYFDGSAAMAIDAPCGCWNPDDEQMVIGSYVNSVVVGNPEFSLFEYDTFWTIGKMFIDEPGQTPNWISNPLVDGANICSEVVTDGVAYVTGQTGNWPENAIAGEDLQILIGRVTTCGSFTITMNAQVFVQGDQDNEELFTMCEEADLDLDGICDSEDDCVGLYDACGICNGPGPILGCGCDDIPVGDCDCQGNQLDAAGICGGDCTVDADADGICDDEDDCIGAYDACGECNGPGAIYECGCADIEPGFCDCDGNQLDALGECGGVCPADEDGDGICDDVDDCVGELDACGICNGPGEIYECGCSDIPEGDCDCDGNQLDALGVCGGDCAADADDDGICDDVDDCVGELDACGICNGPGAIYECGCADIEPGFCDCDGNQFDALGECGGVCPADEDGDGICDDVDDCVGELDACGICNGPGAIYECGCADIEPGFCDCDGNQFDALGECGGVCPADEDGDGICDDVDDCVGELDACGICNGPGAIYECGCADIEPGFCDCDGNQFDALGECGGVCPADEDGDGICDDVDDCVGAFDACGICNGPGEIYECGCAEIEPGFCDCDGNQFDALGECGGVCPADEDGDGICDDVDDCVGELDACGVCNGPGEIYECGCSDIPEGDCDCDGNQLDALGVCGGDCVADADEDGICDDVDDCVGAFDACGICNGPGEIYECGCAEIEPGFCDCDGNQFDALGECGGVCPADEDGDGICDDVDDCVGELDACGICNGPGEIYECGCSDIPEGDCDCDGNQLDALGECGGDCAADADEDGICDDVDDCVGAFDACGICNGPGEIYECGCSDIPEGDCDCDGNQLDAVGVCGGDCVADADEDGICDDVDDCVGELDACGICNGPGEIYECGCSDIPEGDCDCDGNQLDALGECGGDCAADADEDGICDDVDDCVGELDACGICNGPGEIYECGCSDIPEGDCDCDGNQLDALGVCGGDCAADADADGICDDVDDCVGELDACGVCNGPGEIYECGCSDIPEGDCDCDGNQLDALGVCGGDCVADADEDGICDDVDDCVGAFDACGVCNGPGDIYECGCSDIPEGDCDCDGNQLDALGVCGGDCPADADEDGICDDVDDCVGELDALGVCGGDCAADADEDGICDDVDDCVGTFDACGICNGPGEIYECGCSDIPEGDCDCDGNQLDALGVCGGDCAADADEDGICDDVDDCVGVLDACGICNGPGEIYECGCSDIPEGDCDCDGNELDALGVCGGDCAADADEDGICDDVDDCVGVLDACGICNGPGEIYECGCADIPEGDCDCDGNELDALGVCGGDCAADADADGICDDVDDCIGAYDACGVCNGPGVLEYVEAEEACGELIWNDSLFTATGSYGMVFTLPNGCDSAVTLDLVVHEVYDIEDELEACAPLTWNGMELEASGTYTYAGVTEFGCDSVTTVNFELLESTGSLQTVTGCDSVEVDGVWVDETQSLDLYYPNAAGCDSVVVFDIELFESDYAFESLSSCTPIVWNGLTLETSGNYTFQSTNEFGCDSVSEVQFELSDSLFISIASPDQVCEDEPFSVQVNGWSEGDEALLLWVVDTTQFVNVESIEWEVAQTGVQQISVFAETQTCEESATITVEVLDNPSASLLAVNQVDVDCFGEATGVIEIVMDASTPLDYGWSDGVSDSNVAFDLAAGQYDVVVGNQGVCVDTLQFTVDQSLPLTLSLVDSTFADCGLDNGEIVVSADGGVGPYAYSWEPGAWTPSGASLFTLGAGPHTVMVMDNLGCIAEATFDLGCNENLAVLPYEFISPNGNGANDTWVIEHGSQHEDLRVSVYNRWGVEVFSHQGAYYNTWGGTAPNGNVLPSATYYWVVESEGGVFEPLHGFLEIQAP